jgi:hypothetical protein
MMKTNLLGLLPEQVRKGNAGLKRGGLPNGEQLLATRKLL